MAVGMQNLVSDAKRNKFSGIGDLTDDDVISVWDNVSGFIEKHMSQQKGVRIPNLGTFTFSPMQKKMDVGGRYVYMERPVFQLSEKFAQKHGLHYIKHQSSGQFPVVDLNFSALSFESPFDRDSVEASVKEVMAAMDRSVGSKKSLDFTFTGIGRLQIRDNRVKMKFYKDFLNSLDDTGRLVEALKDRPGTGDSVMSNRSASRLVLPKIHSGAPDMPTIQEDGVDMVAELGHEPHDTLVDMQLTGNGDIVISGGGQDDRHVDFEPELDDICLDMSEEPKELTPKKDTSRMGSRMAVPMAQASGISLMEDLIPFLSKPGRSGSVLSKSNPSPLTGRRSLTPLNVVNSAQSPRFTPLAADILDTQRSKSADRVSDTLERPVPNRLLPPVPADKEPTPPGTSCGHKNAGQELCYVCHQRERRNVPVSFTEERLRREHEEDRLLQQYQSLKDVEAIFSEQEQNSDKRHENQKMAAFNLGVSEAVKTVKSQKPTEFQPSYVFQKRPLTPPRFIQQELYFKDLSDQVTSKDDTDKRQRADEAFLERLEQVQLAEDLAAQREQYLRDKKDQQDNYKRALSAQIEEKRSIQTPPSTAGGGIRRNHRMSPMTLPKPNLVIPFSEGCPLRIQIQARGFKGSKSSTNLVRFQPLPLPARVPDSNEPVFGKNDMTNEMMADRRHRAHDLYKEQINTVEQRKRDAILKKLMDHQDESKMIHRTKKELRADRADRYERLYIARKRLEEDWRGAYAKKKGREKDDRELMRSPGMLLHEQCDRYLHCGQCKRQLANCGESNIWRESRYIPGSRLMV